MTRLSVTADDLFGPHNLPYGVYSVAGGTPRVATRYGDHVVDLARLLGDDTFAAPSLNPFMTQGIGRWTEVRAAIAEAVRGVLPDDAVHEVARVSMHLPFEVADYVDFYASEHHASNLGRLFRPQNPDPLMPNWKHLPVGYHGRSASIVVSGTGNPMGQPIGVERADAHIFGVVLFNDWSARDIQAWEYVPLGPNLGKSFASTISPWVVPLLALDTARVPTPAQVPPVLPYLALDRPWGLDIDLEVEWNGQVVSRPPYAEMYWSPAQMLAHMTVNGAPTRTGDLFASGTVSGPEKDQRGAFIELTWGGAEPIEVAGEKRTFLQDGDEVVLRASAPGPGGTRLGFGEARGRVLPSASS